MIVEPNVKEFPTFKHPTCIKLPIILGGFLLDTIG